MMKISEVDFLKKYPPQDFSPSLCGQAGYLGLAVKPKIWEEIDFLNEMG